MALHMICLTKEDINGVPIGSHLNFTTADGFILNLDRGAIDEMFHTLSEYYEWLKLQENTETSPEKSV